MSALVAVSPNFYVMQAGTLTMCGRPDYADNPSENLFAFAQKQDRILLTHNVDFLDDRKFPPDPNRNPGVIVLPGASGGDSILIRAIGEALSLVGYFREVYRGSKIIVSEDGTLTVSSRNRETGRIERTKYRFTKNGWQRFGWIDAA
jgi:hypothetical protein